MKSFISYFLFAANLLLLVREGYAEESKSTAITHSILIIEGKNGAGTGFFSTLNDKKYVFTNAHVFLEVLEPKILDISNTVYGIQKALVHKSEDIAIIQLADSKGLEPLKIRANVENVAIGTKTEVFGNSLGAEVVTKLDGSVEGVGPQKVEVNNGFVSGNSGSPICLRDDGAVIGIATYVTKINDASNISLEGSKFDSKKITSVRRFGLRVDNLQESDFEDVDLEAYQKDIGELDKLKKINDFVIDSFRHFSKNSDANQLRQATAERYGSWAPAKDYQWNSTYMEKEFKEQCTIRDAIVRVLNIKDEVMTYRRIAKLSKKFSKEVRTNIMQYAWGLEKERAEDYAEAIARLSPEKQEKVSSGLLDMRKIHEELYFLQNKSSKKSSGKVKSLVYSVDQIYKELFGVAASEWYENEAKIKEYSMRISEGKKRVAAAKKAAASALSKNIRKEEANLASANAALKECAAACKPYLNKRAEYLSAMRDCAGNLPDAEKPEYIRDALAGKPTR